MGRRSQPCTKHRYREDYCTRCGHRQRRPIVFMPRRKCPSVDVLALARSLVKAINAWANPPKAAVPRDPSRRTKQWEYNAHCWECYKGADLHRECWAAYKALKTVAEQPGYSRANQRMARRINETIRTIWVPNGSGTWCWRRDMLPLLEGAIAKELSRADKGMPE